MRMPGEARPFADIEADWPRLSGLLDEIMELPPVARETYITALPPPDDRLAATLRELLALQAKVETEDFMDELPVFPGVTDPDAVIAGAAGGMIDAAAGGATGAGGLVEGAGVGPYRLLRSIGEGGMGAVWLAERADGTLKRKVALKLPRLAWASDLAARMARERDILAGLEHPNIARLYDAGVDALGRPWLAIEYVEGRDLAAFCDTARLDLRARVRLFLQVLVAVQYAHGSLVIHRDLKPANILVTPQGEARLLDFGIARLEEGAADAGPALTRDGRGAMTPRYASPEQVQGKRLTVASDIYSLGVVLHELLTGETPYTLRRGTRAEYEQAIVESDLRVPSRTAVTEAAAAARSSTPQAIARALRGDLDAVLMRALAPAPEGRYASAAALREDLERWLEGRPVSAVPPSRTYALSKFVARNRLAVAASAVAALALVTVSVVALVQAQRAQREATTATTAKDFLVKIYGAADPLKSDGSDPNARALLERAERDLETQFAGEPALRAEVLKTLQEAWSNLGHPQRSMRLNEQRAALLVSLGRREEAADALLITAEDAIQLRDFRSVERKLAEVDRTIDGVEASPDLQGRYHYARGVLSSEQGKPEEATKAFDRSIEATRIAAAGDPAMTPWLLTRIFGKLFAVRLRNGMEPVRRDLAEVAALIPRLTAEQRKWTKPYLQLAVAHARIGQFGEGWPAMVEAVEQARKDFGHDNPFILRDLRYWLKYCVVTGRAAEAAAWLSGAEASVGPAAWQAYQREASWRIGAAEVYAAVGDWSAYDREIAAARAGLADAPGREQQGYRSEAAQLRLLEARVAVARGRAAEARALLSDSSIVALQDGFREEMRHQRLWILGVAARASGDAQGARADLETAERLAAELMGTTHPEVARVRLDLALAAAASASGVDDSRVAGLVRDATPVLRRCCAAEPRVATRLDRLSARSAGQGDRSDAATRRALAALPDSLNFL